MSEDIEKAINTLRFAAENEDLKRRAIKSLQELLAVCGSHFGFTNDRSTVFESASDAVEYIRNIGQVAPEDETPKHVDSLEMVEHTVLFPKPEEGFSWSVAPNRVRKGDKYLDTKDMTVCVAATNYKSKALYYIQEPIKEEQSKGSYLEGVMSKEMKGSKTRARALLAEAFGDLSDGSADFNKLASFAIVDEVVSSAVSESFVMMSEYVNENFQRKEAGDDQ